MTLLCSVTCSVSGTYGVEKTELSNDFGLTSHRIQTTINKQTVNVNNLAIEKMSRTKPRDVFFPKTQ